MTIASTTLPNSSNLVRRESSVVFHERPPIKSFEDMLIFVENKKGKREKEKIKLISSFYTHVKFVKNFCLRVHELERFKGDMKKDGYLL